MDVPMASSSDPSNASSAQPPGDHGDDRGEEPLRNSFISTQRAAPPHSGYLVGLDASKTTQIPGNRSATSTMDEDGNSNRNSQGEPTRGVKKTPSLRRGAAGYNQLLQAAVMASIQVQKDMGNLNGDDDVEAGSGGDGVPAPPPPSPDSIPFAGGSISQKNGGPFEGGATAAVSPFGSNGSSSSRKNKRSRSHHRQDEDDDDDLVDRMAGTRRSWDDGDGDFIDYDDTTMDLDMTMK